MKAVVAFTPLAGAVLFPIAGPLQRVSVRLGAGVRAAVLTSSLWFRALLLPSARPEHG